MFNLEGKTALVTGASGGIGGAIATALKDAGAKVAISGTRAEALEKLNGEAGGAFTPITCNLSDLENVDALIKQTEETFGQLDILVNNAGITRDGLLMRMKDDDWQSVIDVNLTAAFKLIRAASRGRAGRRAIRSSGRWKSKSETRMAAGSIYGHTASQSLACRKPANTSVHTMSSSRASHDFSFSGPVRGARPRRLHHAGTGLAGV